MRSIKISCRWIPNHTTESWGYSHLPTQEIAMNTIDISTTRRVSRPARIVVISVLALGFAAAVAAVAQESGVTGADIAARMGDYITEVGEALGSEQFTPDPRSP
jgi:hypothetical protein